MKEISRFIYRVGLIVLLLTMYTNIRSAQEDILNSVTENSKATQEMVRGINANLNNLGIK